VVSSLALVVAAVLGSYRLAGIATAASLLVLVIAFAGRLARARADRPTEVIFVGFGLLLGLIGAFRQVLTGQAEVLAGRLLSLGLVLSLVLGLGGLLVPAFTGMPAPLAIPGLSGAHERPRRLALYAVVIAALAAAFVAETLGRDPLGAILRAAAATVMIVWVWKLVRPPARRDAPAWAMWSSGWLVLVGLWLAALLPRFTLRALHVVFIGGFSLLTFGIGTRVVVAHGQYPLSDERKVLPWSVTAVLAVALLARLAAEWMPARAPFFLSASGLLWIAAWLTWALRGLPRIVGPKPISRA
jgi:hypothetical protein